MPPHIDIHELRADDPEAIQQAAALLVEGFRENWPDAWPDLKSALEEVVESLDPERISRIARGGEGKVLGWIGGIGLYEGQVFELHPLVVDPAHHGQGIGSALVEDFEEQVRERGASTIWLGSDDENSMTSLAGIDLYDDLLGHLARIRNFKGHPFEFYRRLGYTIAGVLPDANGPGKPDIFMAKRVAKAP